MDQLCSRASFTTSAFISLTLPFSFGLAIGFSSPVAAYLINIPEYGESVASLFGSILTISFMFGAIPGGKILTTYGSQKSMVVTAVPLAVGWSLLYVAELEVMALLYIGRILTGIGSGLALVASPAYISEITLPDKRGLYGSAVQLLITIGILCSYLMGAMTDWRNIALFGAVTAVLSGFLTYTLPDTPAFLVREGNHEKAKTVLTHLRQTNNVDDELSTLSTGRIQASVGFATIQRSLRPLLLMFGLNFFQQTNGINTIMYFTETIFVSAGFKDYSSSATVIVGLVQVIFTLVACFTMDKFGRRQLLATSSVLMGAACFVLGYYYIQEMNNSTGSEQSLALWCLVVYIIGFALGWGPVPLLMMAEMFSVEMQGFASAMSLTVNTVLAFIITSSYVPLSGWIGAGSVFILYGVSCAISIAFSLLLLVETKGKSRNQIVEYFDTGNFQLLA